MRSYKLRGAYNLLMQLLRRRDRRRRGVLVGGQPRAGFRAGLPVDGHPRPGLRAGQDAEAEARPDPLSRRRVHRADRRRQDLRQAAAAALDDVARTGATLVPPYDDPRTMAGQGTIAVEILDQLDGEPDLVIVPVGGGGCIAGITTYLAERTTNTSVLGVEPAGAAAMMAALAAGEPVTLDHVDQFVDGAAVNRAGALTVSRRWRRRGTWCRSPRSTRARCAPRCSTCTRTRASSPSPPARCRWPACWRPTSTPGSTVVCLISGGNNDVSRYGEVLERSLVHLGLKHYFLVDFPQEPGALRRFLDEVLGPERRHHAVRVRQAQQPGDRRGAGRHRAGLGRRPRRPAGADAGLRHSRRDARAGLAGLPLPDLTGLRR